ncbi:MAG TPA: hydantoinase/carbamoylase family amidase [Thermomicrobiaceae bacterium]|nr:hydantoinase/carbamoylase family amidase [Thermomicrobiaceae bacterium]
MAAITIDAGRLEQELLALAKIGQHGETGVWRTAYSPEWLDAQNHILGWCREAGFEARMDAAGNVWGTLAGTEAGKSVVSGSHIDSQKPGGRYDGTLGVLAALSAVRALSQQFGRPRRTLEIVSLAEEESSRFPGSNFLGSRAIIGRLSPQDAEEMHGYEGETLAEAMREAGLDPLKLPTAARDDIADFIELHIEQGPILEQAGVPVGIVTAINGIRHYVVELTGRSDHAGARPMDTRLDPLAGAAEIALGAIDTALRMGRPAVTTIGRMEVEPNGPAIVPEKVTFTIDARHSNPAARQQLYQRHEDWMRAVAARRGLGLNYRVTTDVAPLVIDPAIVALLEESAREQQVPYLAMPSGAVHDTQNMAAIARVGMVFVQSQGGRSHTPAEHTALEDAVAGVQVLAGALQRLAY